MSDSEQKFHGANPAEAARQNRLRPVILHFHTFKNAGTSVDAILQLCFPGGWANFDGPTAEFFMHHSEMSLIARDRPHLKAISSHHIRLPVPRSANVEFLPLVFIRRPELRIASVWRFHRQMTEDHPDVNFAKELGFRDWIIANLAKKDKQVVFDGQKLMFSHDEDKRRRVWETGALLRATRNIGELPLVGIVEEFDVSMRLFEMLYRPKVPEFRFIQIEAENVTGDPELTTQEQIESVREALGEDVFEQMMAANESDIKLYEMAVSKFEKARREWEPQLSQFEEKLS